MGKILWQWVEERERGGLSECARLPSTQPYNFKKPVRPKTPSSFFHSNQSWHKQWPYRPLTLDKTLSLRYSSISLLCFFDSWTFTVRKRKRVLDPLQKVQLRFGQKNVWIWRQRSRSEEVKWRVALQIVVLLLFIFQVVFAERKIIFLLNLIENEYEWKRWHQGERFEAINPSLREYQLYTRQLIMITTMLPTPATFATQRRIGMVKSLRDPNLSTCFCSLHLTSTRFCVVPSLAQASATHTVVKPLSCQDFKKL